MNRPRILIVDDREPNIIALEETLRGIDVDIDSATSGKEAIKKIEVQDYAVLLLDVQMPEMNGFEVAKHLSQNPNVILVPIIFVTAISRDEKFIYEGYESGAVDYLFKPLDPKIVRGKVNIFLELFNKNFALKEANEKLLLLSSVDGLTGIANRRNFDDFLDSTWRRSLRNKTSLSLLLLDIDFFKKYNDGYGHQAGDECLKKVAKNLSEIVRRPEDLLARYGGEEFVIVLGNTDVKAATSLAGKARSGIEALEILHDHREGGNVVTISIGISCVIPKTDLSPSGLIGAADKALYKAKNEGRNRVELDCDQA
jgi:diguanylate cyclase (GGDEF)-like protein